MDINRSLSLVAVADNKVLETIKALLLSRKRLNQFFIDEVILLTSKKINKKYLHKLKVIRIKPINSFKEYNDFIIKDLHKYISSTHILLIQWDGFVINGHKWNEKFLDFDYIGSPFIPRAQNYSYGRNPNGKFYSVGNGGFSLRSLKLLQAAKKYNLKDNFKITNNHEDGFFCVMHRDFLEKKGFKYATFSVAKEFAIESPLSFDEILNLPLGFHGKKMLFIIKFFFIKTIFQKLLTLMNLNFK